MKLREEIPELSGATTWLNGEVTKGELLGNKSTLIHFWSVSCGLCKNAMPEINEFRNEFADKLHVISVHMPRSEKDLDIEVIKSATRDHRIFHPTYVDSDRILTDAFENKYVPAYYIFDTDGKLRHFQAGSGGMKMLHKRIVRILGIEVN